MINTRSVFYYGHVIDETNFSLDFNEGGGEITANLNLGSYTLTEYATEVQRALNDAGALDYTVTVNRDTRILTIAASANFDLLVSTGSTLGVSTFGLAGFTGVDRTGAATYDGDTASGSEYKPQFKLQSYVPSENFVIPNRASVNTSASGRNVETVTFGDVNFTEFNITFVTDRPQGLDSPMENNPNAVSELRDFLTAVTKKNTIEFMPDRDNRGTFENLLLERTQSDRNGVGFQLFEMLNKSMPGFYESKRLRFRKIT